MKVTYIISMAFPNADLGRLLEVFFLNYILEN